MKSSHLLLLPFIVLFIAGCAGGPGYGDYGPGPNPRPGYYWNGTVYVEGENPYYHHQDQYSRDTTTVNNVDINRTSINDRTVNNSDARVNNETVNNRQASKRTVKRTNAASERTDDHKKAEKPNGGAQNNPQGNQ